MRHVGHFIPADNGSQIFNPSSGKAAAIAAVGTNGGGLARRFVDEAGQIGINVPIPFPVCFHDFAGRKNSAFVGTKLFGPCAIAFHTRTKTVSARRPDVNSTRVDLAFPISN
jgi:malonate-semialdehyde dehydrogenase (acetylating)/methylmalonate-semialdehyde dehydrogenase